MSTPARAPSRRPSPRPVPAHQRDNTVRRDNTVQRDNTVRRDDPTRTESTRTEKAPPNLEVVAPDRRRALRLRLLGGLAGLLLFGALLGLAVFHSVLVQGQLGLDRMDAQIEAERELQRSLRKDVAGLASPERIQAEAVRLGMVLPDERAYLQAVVPGQNVPPPGADR